MKYKLLFAGLATMCVQAIAFAQNSQGQKPSTWQSYYKDAKVEIDYRYANCELPSEGLNEENLYFQFKNLTSNNISISFEQELFYGDKCYNCEGGNPEYKKTVILSPKQTIAGDCTGIISGELKVLSRLKSNPNLPSLSEFKVKNVSCIEINNK